MIEFGADYSNDLDRGTVQYSLENKNYSFCKVEIPSGSVIDGCNFAQAQPVTDCIICNGEITFLNCNLSNVLLKPEWEIINCNLAQSWITSETVDGKIFDTRIPAVGVDPFDVNTKPTKPNNAVTERAF